MLGEGCSTYAVEVRPRVEVRGNRLGERDSDDPKATPFVEPPAPLASGFVLHGEVLTRAARGDQCEPSALADAQVLRDGDSSEEGSPSSQAVDESQECSSDAPIDVHQAIGVSRRTMPGSLIRRVGRG